MCGPRPPHVISISAVGVVLGLKHLFKLLGWLSGPVTFAYYWCASTFSRHYPRQRALLGTVIDCVLGGIGVTRGDPAKG